MIKSRAAIFGFAAAALAAVVVGRVSAGADPSQTAANAPAPSTSPVVVTIKDFVFSPATVSIPVGGSITWKNLDQAAHTATDKNGAFDSGNLDTGKSYTFTFKKAGTYQVLCTYHPSMHETVIVGGGSGSPPPATPDSSGY
jgi:plastocyanin